MDVMTAFAFCMVLLLVLLLVGVPLPYCFAGALIFMVATCGIPIKSLFVWGYSQMISTSLMAVPMFIIAGNLIAESSIAEKLVDLARIFVGKVKGALGCICVVVCGIMGAISGSAFTGIAALGSIMIPELQKEGYSRGFATSLVTCSSILGTLIPPSIPIIVLGWTTGISILGCFMATVVPGIITILTFSAINVFPPLCQEGECRSHRGPGHQGEA
jgi:C4-dicarboxylate transporter DctM subunit